MCIITTMRGITMDNVLMPVLAGAILLPLMLGPLGAFVVWRRMAYFGDTIAHSSLLGVALSLVFQWPMQGAILLVALGVAALLAQYSKRVHLEADTLLGILAHGGLALGILVIALTGAPEVELEAYLFGDILMLDWEGVSRLAALAVLVCFLLVRYWRRLLMATIDPAIATVEGVSPTRMQLLLTVLIAVVIAFTVKLTGVLLITALLIVPAAVARQFAQGPKQMAAFSAFVGIVSCVGGLLVARAYQLPAAPAMVVAAVALFALSNMVQRKA